jgi:hypothetical protein
MMIECPKFAYEKIVSNKALYSRIIKKKDSWGDVLLGADFCGKPWGIIEKAQDYFKDLSDLSKIDRRLKEIFLDILELHLIIEINNYFCTRKEETLIENPTLLAYAVLGKDLANPQKYGFVSRRQLEGSIASFCIGEHWNIGYTYGERYVWRNRQYKNYFCNAPHGDLFLSQKDVSDYHHTFDTFFGAEEDFDTWKDTEECTNCLTSFQNWSNLLMCVLRYAEAIGKGRLPEITNWREIEKGLDGTIPATGEAFGGNPNFHLNFIQDTPILIEGKDVDTMPLCVVSGISDEAFLNLAYVKDGKLCLLREDKNGSISPLDKGYFKGKRYSIHMEFDESDLPDLLKGIYKLYSRDRTELPEIMDLYMKNPHKA